MDSADTSFGYTGTTAALLRELRGERRAATGGLAAADRFVSSGDGSAFFAHHLRPLREASSPPTGPHAEPMRRDDGPDIYRSRQAAGIVRRTFETSSGMSAPSGAEDETSEKAGAESARGLQEEPEIS